AIYCTLPTWMSRRTAAGRAKKRLISLLQLLAFRLRQLRCHHARQQKRCSAQIEGPTQSLCLSDASDDERCNGAHSAGPVVGQAESPRQDASGKYLAADNSRTREKSSTEKSQQRAQYHHRPLRSRSGINRNYKCCHERI